MGLQKRKGPISPMGYGLTKRKQDPNWKPKSFFILDLQLLVDKKDMPMDSSMDPWDMIKSTDVVEPCALPIANHHRITSNQHQNGTKVVQIPLNFNPKINTTSLFNTV